MTKIDTRYMSSEAVHDLLCRNEEISRFADRLYEEVESLREIIAKRDQTIKSLEQETLYYIKEIEKLRTLVDQTLYVCRP